jgi:hypothetical protein
LKIKLKARHFNTNEVIEAESHTVLNTLTQHDFEDAVKKWQKRQERYTRKGTTSRLMVAVGSKLVFDGM